MKIKTIILSGFLLIALLAALVGYIDYYQLEKTTNPLEESLSREVSFLSGASILNSNAQLIRYYDEILTMSARNYAFTGDNMWKQRYYQTVPLLEKSIGLATEKGSTEDLQDFEKINGANEKLIDLEEEAIILVDQGRKEDAINLLEGETYGEQKRIYSEGLEGFLKRNEAVYENILGKSTENLELLNKQTKESLEARKKSSILFVSMIFFLSLTLGLVYSRYLSQEINEVTKKITKITKGDLNIQLNESEIEEINNLSESLQRILASMKLAILKIGISKESIGIGDSIIKNKIESQEKVSNAFSKSKKVSLRKQEKEIIKKPKKNLNSKKTLRKNENKKR